ncbi:helix-turn-helix domain-containing protein [Sphingomonas sp.]
MNEVPSFSIEALGPSASPPIDTFAAAVSDVFAVIPLADPSGPSPAAVEAQAWHLGTMMLGRFAGPPLSFVRSPALVAGSGLDHILVQLYVKGGFSGVAGDQPIDVRAGDICAFDLCETLDTRSTAFSNISLLIPRDGIAGTVDPQALHGLVLCSDQALGAMLADYLASLVARIGTLNRRDALFAATATASLVGTVLSGEALKRSGQQPVSAFASPLRRACAFIDEHIADPALDTAMLVRALGLSRAHLYRLFAGSGGVKRHIRRRRLSGAALDLSDPLRALRVGDVARRWGFASDASFARSFRAAFGIAPRDARERGLSLLAREEPDGEGQVDAAGFAYWMRTLHAHRPDRP